MTYIFWGYILTLLDFNINRFDILPDFIGYALIFAGVHKLSALSKHFSKARIFSAIMFVYTFSELFHFETIILEQDIFMIFIMAANLFLLFVPIYLMYLITCGVGSLEQQSQTDLGKDLLLRIWKVFLLISVSVYILMWLSTRIPGSASIVMVMAGVLAIGALLAMTAWVVCIYIAKKRYANAELHSTTSEIVPLVHTKSIVFALVATMLILGMTVLSYSEYANIMRHGLYYVECISYDNYRFTEHATKDSNYVTIDWNDVQSAVGKELYRDGDCVIFISEIQDDHNGGYRIFFTAEGEYGYQSGRLVTPVSHKATLEKDNEVILSNIHQNWPNDAMLQVAIGDKTYTNKQWCGRAQSMERGIDEIGYYMFSNEYYERGEMILTDDIQENDNQIRIRLVGLREVEYQRR